jgi:hypothetical protein
MVAMIGCHRPQKSATMDHTASGEAAQAPMTSTVSRAIGVYRTDRKAP